MTSNRFNSIRGIIKRPKVCISKRPQPTIGPSGPCSATPSPQTFHLVPGQIQLLSFNVDDLDSPPLTAVQVDPFDNGGTTILIEPTLNTEEASLQWRAGPATGTFSTFWRFTFESGCHVDGIAIMNIAAP